MQNSNNRHPKALPYLFFTEMWERYGYYLILGIFVLYLSDFEKGGLRLERNQANDIFGTFIALTYLTPFIGGFLADRFLGYSRSIIIGGILMGAGYLGMAFLPGLGGLYISLASIIIGNGFFKPNISTLLGNLYSEPAYQHQKDNGYNIFYMGINIGAFICNFFAAFLQNKFNWQAAFSAAGIGMFLGIGIFLLGRKHYMHADIKKETAPQATRDLGLKELIIQALLPAIAFGFIGWFLKGPGGKEAIMGSNSTDAFLFATIPVVGFFASLYFRGKPNEKKPILALLSIFAVSIMFWAVFKQNGTALTTWAQFYTDRNVQPSLEEPVKALYLGKDLKDTVLPAVIQYDANFNVIKDAQGNALQAPGKDIYFRNLDPALQKEDGSILMVYNTELFQSVNPGFVILLTPVVVGIFLWLRRRKLEPSTPSKIALGLFISALSAIVMVGAVGAADNGALKASAWWLFGTYGVITLGELCLSPMGLSLVSKLSPPRLTGLMMGGFFLSTSIGNKLSGVLASMWDTYEDKASYFWVNSGLLIGATILILIILPWLNRTFKEYQQSSGSGK